MFYNYFRNNNEKLIKPILALNAAFLLMIASYGYAESAGERLDEAAEKRADRLEKKADQLEKQADQLRDSAEKKPTYWKNRLMNLDKQWVMIFIC